MKRKMCPVCGSKNINKLLKIYQFCTNCKTAWIINLPKVKYTEKYYKAKSNFIGLLFKPVEKFFYFLRSLYVGQKEKNLWIDIGAGEGKFLKSVNAKRKIGVEISKAGREMMESSGINTLTNEKFLNLKNKNADVISFWHVLEHVDNPQKYLAAASINLQKRGKIIIGVPNIESADFRFFKKYWFHLAPKYHIWHFSKMSLAIILKKANLKIKSIDYFSLEHHLPGILQSFINMSAGSNNVLHGLIKRNVNAKFTSGRDLFWIFFWVTFGLPVVFIFWLINSIFETSGTFVIIAIKDQK